MVLLLSVRAAFHPPKELFRKILHLTCTMSIFILLYAFSSWYLAMGTALLFALALYPVLTLLERYPTVMDVLTQRRGGELRHSLVTVFLMMAILIGIFWGWLGEGWRFIVIASVMAWGFGDAAAALVGKAFGRHPIRHRFVEGTKTKEGTLAMFVMAAAAIFFSLLIFTALPAYLCFLCALLAAPVSALVELISHRGMDTITVPLSTAIPIYSVFTLITYLGV